MSIQWKSVGTETIYWHSLKYLLISLAFFVRFADYKRRYFEECWWPNYFSLLWLPFIFCSNNKSQWSLKGILLDPIDFHCKDKKTDIFKNIFLSYRFESTLRWIHDTIYIFLVNYSVIVSAKCRAKCERVQLTSVKYASLYAIYPVATFWCFRSA